MAKKHGTVVKKKFKWSARQLHALKMSWYKWDRLCRDSTAIECGQNDCKCCQYYFNYGEKECNTCPIKIYTGFRLCHRTPYGKWLRLVRSSCYYMASTPLRRAAAEKERDFILMVTEAGQ